MGTVKLFVCCHRPEPVPEHPLLLPIQVGAALTGERFSGFLQDDTSENISAKNRSYCELTAQYWAWKNVEADYYGFFHYRRYLYPDICARWPYRIAGAPTLPLLDKLGYGGFEEFIRQYDLIVPMGENMYVPVWEHYASAPFHHRKDLELVKEIVRQRHPEMAESMEAYLSSTVCYFGNIYIMKREVFHDYCTWLFPILEEFDRRADTNGYTPQERRVDGYLAERLLGVYFIHFRKYLRILELPRVHFVHNHITATRLQLATILFPPGTKWRKWVKALEGEWLKSHKYL